MCWADDLIIDGNPNIKGTIQINGNANISKSNFDIVHGGVGEREAIEFPELNESLMERYRQTVMAEGNYYEDDTFPLIISGTTFVDSDVNIMGNIAISGNGVLVVNGDLAIHGNTKIISDKAGALVFVVKGDVIISGNESLECVFFTEGNLR